MKDRDWGARRVPPAPTDTLLRSLEVLDDRYARMTLSRVGARVWEARTYCGCEPDSTSCRCAAGHGDTAREALAALLDQLR